MKHQISIKELVRFLVGGGSAVLTDYIVYKLLLSCGLDMGISKGISFICGSIVGFIINKFWTFESKSFIKVEIGKYIILYSGTAITNILVNHLVLYILAMEGLAFLCATGVSTVLNFLGQKFFVFNNKREKKKDWLN